MSSFPRIAVHGESPSHPRGPFLHAAQSKAAFFPGFYGLESYPIVGNLQGHGSMVMMQKH
jgi:hypothetical protein